MTLIRVQYSIDHGLSEEGASTFGYPYHNIITYMVLFIIQWSMTIVERSGENKSKETACKDRNVLYPSVE